MVIDQRAEQEIHKRQLYITHTVFDLCSEHGICCFLVGGSLLGAVKEKGILKGDKDIDIGMLREDYSHFCKIVSELPDDLCFLEARTDSSYNWLFAKIYQKGTKLVPKFDPMFGPITGIYVDIIPYDFVSEDEKTRLSEYKSAKMKKWIMLLKGQVNKPDLKMKVIALLGKTQNRGKIIRYFSNGFNKTSVVQNIVGGTDKDWFLLEEIYSLREVLLNGYSFFAPDYERYLNLNYPGWQLDDMSRNELYDFEVEYE